MTSDADGGTPNGTGVTCAAVPVDVEDKPAVWIFTEFQTGDSLEKLRDWLIPDHRARASPMGVVSVSNWPEVTVRPSAGADPARSARTMEHTTRMVTARSDDSRVSITHLTRVGEKAATIPSSKFTVTSWVIDKVGPTNVPVQAESSKFPPGLYERSLVAGAGGKQAPTLFCVSHAQIAGD